MKKLKSNNKLMDYIALFILNAALMVLELVASRFLSPYFGNSNFVWTAIIGIILLAGSLGNLIGGRIASLRLARLYTSLLLLFSVIYLAITPLIGNGILKSIDDVNMGVQGASVISSILFFLVPSICLSVITPVVLKTHLDSTKDRGRESGRITALMAIGSLVGTFAGGFWLIPAIGTKMIFETLALTILVCILLFSPVSELKNNLKAKIFFWFLMIAGVIVNVVAIVNINKHPEEIISIDTEYGRIIIEDGLYNDEPVRFYKQSGAYSSATFIDEEKRNDLVYDYLKKYNEMFKYRDIKNVAMIGGAAYQYPKYFIAHYPDKTIDVIEIDPESTRIAKEYFYLEENPRLGLYNADGRVFLADSDTKYDAILNDAFSGEVPVATLATKEAAKIIKDSLQPDGVYISNTLGAISGEKSRFVRSEVKTLKQVFKYVYILPVHDHITEDIFTNWMIVATDNNEYKPKNAIEVKFLGDEIIFTDDYHPIDSMVKTDYFDN